MPHLVEMDKRNRKKGLRVIANECQNSTEEAIAAVTKENKVEYNISRGARGPVNGSGIPHAYVFDVTGQLIFNGNPFEEDFERTIKKALRDVSDEEESGSFGSATASSIKGPLIAERSWTNAEGNTIVASVTEVMGEFVSFRMQNGNVVPYAIEKLSESDQALIKESAEKEEE